MVLAGQALTVQSAIGNRLALGIGLSTAVFSVANALLLPHVSRFNFSAAPERYADISVALGLSRNGSPLTTAEHGVEFLSQLSRACGVPQKLSELDIPHTAIPALAKSAMQVTRLLKNNLRPVTEADAVKIYEATF